MIPYTIEEFIYKCFIVKSYLKYLGYFDTLSFIKQKMDMTDDIYVLQIHIRKYIRIDICKC
jgi:hypothetical protein